MHTAFRVAFRTLAATSLAAVTVTASAAEQGNVGSSSSNGNFVITLEVNDSIVVKNFDDMNLSTTGTQAGETIEASEDICVAAIGIPLYNVTLTSGNGDAIDPYLLNNGTDTLAYNVAFAGNTIDTDGTAPGSNGAVTGDFDTASGLDCAGDNARVFVSIPSTEWEQAASTDDYSDTLTVTVAAL